jgi:hypothetical protein
MARLETLFPMPLLNLLLVSRQIYHEVKDFMFSITTFKIDVRKDGAFMCGRRLLEPKRADGSSHFLADEADNAKKRFLKTFNWSAVKNYTVDILLENCENPHFVNHNGPTSMPAWDEEVEIYDIRGNNLPSVSVTELSTNRHTQTMLVWSFLASWQNRKTSASYRSESAWLTSNGNKIKFSPEPDCSSVRSNDYEMCVKPVSGECLKASRTTIACIRLRVGA